MARSTLTFSCPLQVKGSFQTQREAGRRFSPVHSFQTSFHLRHPHCPKIEAPRPNLGPGGPTLCPALPPTSPMVPPVQGTRVGSCVTGCTKTLLKPIFRDFCPAGWEVTAACLAKDLTADKTFGCWGTVVMSATFLVSPKHGADCRGSSVKWAPSRGFLCPLHFRRAHVRGVFISLWPNHTHTASAVGDVQQVPTARSTLLRLSLGSAHSCFPPHQRAGSHSQRP